MESAAEPPILRRDSLSVPRIRAQVSTRVMPMTLEARSWGRPSGVSDSANSGPLGPESEDQAWNGSATRTTPAKETTISQWSFRGMYGRPYCRIRLDSLGKVRQQTYDT
jgi:hypothetical protein